MTVGSKFWHCIDENISFTHSNTEGVVGILPDTGSSMFHWQSLDNLYFRIYVYLKILDVILGHDFFSYI